MTHSLFRRALRAHRFDGSDRRPDEDDACVLTGRGELRVLGQEAVAGMDCIGTGLFRRLENPRNVEVALRRWTGADRPSFVCLAHVERVRVDVRVHRDDTHAEAARGPRYAAGNFAAIGDQQGADRFPGLCLDHAACASRPIVRQSYDHDFGATSHGETAPPGISTSDSATP